MTVLTAFIDIYTQVGISNNQVIVKVLSFYKICFIIYRLFWNMQILKKYFEMRNEKTDIFEIWKLVESERFYDTAYHGLVG